MTGDVETRAVASGVHEGEKETVGECGGAMRVAVGTGEAERYPAQRASEA